MFGVFKEDDPNAKDYRTVQQLRVSSRLEMRPLLFCEPKFSHFVTVVPFIIDQIGYTANQFLGMREPIFPPTKPPWD
jgi:hypothetical protein